MRMGMLLTEEILNCPTIGCYDSLLSHFRRICCDKIYGNRIPVRFAVTSTTSALYKCEIGIIEGLSREKIGRFKSIFEFRPRVSEAVDKFNVVLMVPTGIGAVIGGHAGDAGPVVRVLANVSDSLIVHPNVVNGSDLNEMPRNCLYVEGSVITRLLMGTIGLRPVRSNRLLVVLDKHADEAFVHAAVNAVNAARATYGLSCYEIVCLDPPVRMQARFAPSGRAAGRVEKLEGVCEVLEDRAGEFDAVALSSVIDVPSAFHQEYFDALGEMVNPWGGVEAMLTHALSSIYDIPTAHSPMFESKEIANLEPGVVDARMAAEAVSTTFLLCTLKGLQRSPGIVTDLSKFGSRGVFSATDISCLVIPDGCLGLPTLAALEQGITVIAVRENQNIMKNELSLLPWASDQFFCVDNYWEAAGVIAAIRAGVDPAVVRRPLDNVLVSDFSASDSDGAGILAQVVAK